MPPAPCHARMPTLWVAIEKHPISTLPLETLSRHKFFCLDRNVLPLGKLCRDTRRPLLQPKPGPTLNLVATLNLCRDTGPTNLCRARESLCHDPNHLACLGTMLRHRDPCIDIKPESSVVRAHCVVVSESQLREHVCHECFPTACTRLSRARPNRVHICHAHLGLVVCLALEPCHDMEDSAQHRARETPSRQNFLCRDRGP